MLSEFDVDRAAGESAFTVDLEGFEGPLDLLLELARRQKVDLSRISVLALAEQYIVFVEEARKLRLELAADYLVMAAWLAFLKSRLLLPAPPQAAGPDASELADALAERLRRLQAIRKAAELLIARPRLGRDFFQRGEPEAVDAPRRARYAASLYDLLAAYARQAQKHARAKVRFQAREVWSLTDAREALADLIGGNFDWIAFDDWLAQVCLDRKLLRSARASTFSASLELMREGKIELRQEKTFAPIYIRATVPSAQEGAAA
ncbi:MAG TPA: ScpA family protein [Roseiarcus sp.]|nr:ScpA family protein [Roseiarcus sp.]